MGKKMKFPSIFNTNTPSYPPPPPPPPSRSSSSWVWPAAYCQQPKTLSFRNGHDPTTIYKTINSAYNIADDASSVAPAESASPSTGSASVDRAESSLETVIQGLRSERLFFQPGETSRSILEEANFKPPQQPIINDNKDDDEDVVQNPMIKESVALTMESRNPYIDFKTSMEEMVEANGLLLADDGSNNSSCSWDGLEELLCWYLRMNGRSNHGYIISAFVDLLVGNFANLSTNHTGDNCGTTNNTIISNYHPSPSSPLSFYTSSTSTSSKYSSDDFSSTPCCVSSLESGEEMISSAPQCFTTLLESNEQ